MMRTLLGFFLAFAVVTLAAAQDARPNQVGAIRNPIAFTVTEDSQTFEVYAVSRLAESGGCDVTLDITHLVHLRGDVVPGLHDSSKYGVGNGKILAVKYPAPVVLGCSDGAITRRR